MNRDSSDPTTGPAPSLAHAADRRSEPSRRVLFLDDDPARAEAFLEGNPLATWVQTARDCIERLGDPWDEVFLDHDLGGEHFVDVDRPDCGMEVVRWLCKEPRSHLASTRFVIHSHNLTAALMMVLLMRETGYVAEFQPFGFSLELDALASPTQQGIGLSDDRWPPTSPSRPPARRRLLSWIRRLVGKIGRA